jgi:diguanylate cyclase (GGDEF)-like protein
MPKQLPRPASAPARPGRAGSGRRLGTAEGPVPVGRAPTAAQLVAEVDRLERELAEARAKLIEAEALAEVDPLTGILNRRGFERELTRALAYLARYGGQAALVWLDLDGFKPVNDRYGHAAGDAVLRGVAATLRREVRASDAVGRIGGDEFAVLLWNIQPAQADAKARRLETAIAAMPADPSGPKVGASAGVTPLDPRAGASDALAAADRAMYVRKAQRKG